MLNTIFFRRYNCSGLNFGKVDVGRYTDVSTRYVDAWAKDLSEDSWSDVSDVYRCTTQSPRLAL